MMSLDEVVATVREEVEKHVLRDFGDADHFVRDLHILSDDLTAIALSLEKELGVRLDRDEYRKISNVQSFAQALYRQLAVEAKP